MLANGIHIDLQPPPQRMQTATFLVAKRNQNS